MSKRKNAKPKHADVNLPVSGTWRSNPSFLCRACGEPARLHPETNFIWGCSQCGFSTSAVAVYFTPSAEFDYPVAARAIALWLHEFCEEGMPYPAMIAAAARRAAKEVACLREEIEQWRRADEMRKSRAT